MMAVVVVVVYKRNRWFCTAVVICHDSKTVASCRNMELNDRLFVKVLPKYMPMLIDHLGEVSYQTSTTNTALVSRVIG
jgi:hypothetical protein